MEVVLLLRLVVAAVGCWLLRAALELAVELRITPLVSNSHKIMFSTFQTTPKAEKKTKKMQCVESDEKVVE